MDMLQLLPKNNKIICPFRNNTKSYQLEDSVVQEVWFPECQYEECPYYDGEALTKLEKCRWAMSTLEVGSVTYQ